MVADKKRYKCVDTDITCIDSYLLMRTASSNYGYILELLRYEGLQGTRVCWI